jgi:GTP cyclohydrolase I
MEKNMMDKNKIMEGVKLILEGIGEDVDREGLAGTPDRIARMYEEIFSGMGQTAEEPLSKTFHVDSSEMVIEKDITFYSMCEHHFMPFYGKAHIAYIPDGKVVGLSKLARTVEVYAKRPQLQEQLTAQIADALMEYLKPKGAIVMIEAEHMCMTMRGVKKPGSRTVTYAARGVFKDERLADRFFQLV